MEALALTTSAIADHLLANRIEAQEKARTYPLSCGGVCPCSTTSSLTCSRPTSSSSISRRWILPRFTASARIATAPAALAPSASRR